MSASDELRIAQRVSDRIADRLVLAESRLIAIRMLYTDDTSETAQAVRDILAKDWRPEGWRTE